MAASRRSPTGAAKLVEAAAAGDLAGLSRALSDGVPVDAAAPGTTTFGSVIAIEGATPLAAAAGFGHVDVCRALLEAGADADRSTGSGDRPLAVAAAMGHEAVIELLLARGAAPGGANATGDTALHFAVRFTHLGSTRRLIAAGAPLEARDRFGSTPLHWAVQLGGRTVLPGEAAIAALARYNGITGEAMRERLLARDRDALGILNALVEGGADPNSATAIGETPFHAAVSAGNVPLARLLLAHRADPRRPMTHGDSPLHLACESAPMTRLLLESGANPDQRNDAGETPALAAAEAGAGKVLELLAGAGADLALASRKGETPASVAARAGRRKLVELLERLGARPEAADSKALLDEELLEAATTGNAARLGLLLRRGANARAEKEGSSALFLAAEGGHAGAVRALLAGGASVDAGRPSGATPLHAACAGGHEATARLLLAAGAAPGAAADLGDGEGPGSTPLLLSARRGAPRLVEALLEAGADPDARTGAGGSPLVAAALARNAPAVKRLLAAGAPPDPAWPHLEEMLVLPKRLGSALVKEALAMVGPACGARPERLADLPEVVLFRLPEGSAPAGPPPDPAAVAGAVAERLGLDATGSRRLVRNAGILRPEQRLLHARLAELGEGVRSRGASLVAVSTIGGDGLALLPTPDPIAIVAALGPAPGGFPSTARRLEELLSRFPFRLDGAGGATLLLRFTGAVTDRAGLAAAISRFDADEVGLVTSGVHLFAGRARELEPLLALPEPVVRLWWD